MEPIKSIAEEKSGGHGCLYGCLAGIVIIVAAVGLLAYGIYYAGNKVLNTVASTTPMELPKTALPEADMAAALQRYQEFMAAVKEQPEVAHTLEMTGEEINALFLSKPEFEELTQYVHLNIVDDTIAGQVSFPVGKIIAMPFLEGLYVNGEATFSASIANGRLMVFIETLNVKGAPVPESVMAQFRSENLLKGLQSDVELQNMLKKVETLAVESGKLTVKVKAQAPAPAPAQAPEPAPAPEQTTTSSTTVST